MKLLFIHVSEKVKEDTEGCLYTDGSYDMNIWSRYLDLADDISLLSRKENIIYSKEVAEKKFNILKKINFIEVDNLLDIANVFNIKKRMKYKQIIRKSILDADGVIIRGEEKYAMKCIKKYKKKHLVEVVCCNYDSFKNHSLLGKFVAIPQMIKQRQVIKQASNVVYVTEKFLQTRYPTKGRSIGISDVNIGIVDKNILDKRLEKINNNKDKLVIGTLGSVDARYKGQESVIKAIYNMKNNGVNKFKYYIAGPGEGTRLKELIEKLGLEKDVILCGNIPRNSINNWLDNIDIYIQPSKTEGLPRSLVEAMSRACCCFGTNIGGIPELLNKNDLLNDDVVNELVHLLTNLDKQKMIMNSTYCFNKASEFSSDKLDVIRKTFYSECFCDSYN